MPPMNGNPETSPTQEAVEINKLIDELLKLPKGPETLSTKEELLLRWEEILTKKYGEPESDEIIKSAVDSWGKILLSKVTDDKPSIASTPQTGLLDRVEEYKPSNTLTGKDAAGNQGRLD